MSKPGRKLVSGDHISQKLTGNRHAISSVISSRLARKIGTVLTVASVIGAGTTWQEGASSIGTIETNVADCRPASSGNQCAIINNEIDLRAVARLTKTIPAPVRADQQSVVGIIEFDMGANSNQHNQRVSASTGYVIRGSMGQNVVRSAAHTVTYTSGLPRPAFEVMANVAGALHTLPVTAAQIPRDYTHRTEFNNALNIDVSQLTIPARGWSANISALNGASVHGGVNGFSSLRPIPEEKGRLPIGTIVYDEARRMADGKFLVPPNPPQTEAMVVAGYISGPANRVVLIPEDQARSWWQWEGNSGSPVLTASGEALATMVTGVQMSALYLVDHLGIGLAGYKMDDTVQIELATLNNAPILQDLNNNSRTIVESGTYLP